MIRLFAILVVILMTGVFILVNSPSQTEPVIESVLPTHTILRVRNGEGSFSVTALSSDVRKFTWHGRVATDQLASRGKKYRWLGSFGLFESRAELRGPGWFEVGNFIEAQRHYSREADAIQWLRDNRDSRGPTFLWTHDGLVAYFHEEIPPQSYEEQVLQVWLYQLCIKGKRPRLLPDASDEAIRLTSTGGSPATPYPCTNPGPVNNQIISPPLPIPLPT